MDLVREMNKLRSVNVFKQIIEQLNQMQFDDVAVDESVICEALKQYQVGAVSVCESSCPVLSRW